MRAADALRAGLTACAIGILACGAAAVAHSRPDGTVAAASGADWPQFDYNAQRTGVGPARTGINSRTIHRLRVRTVQLDGTVDSAPIELHAVAVRGRRRDVVVVTTAYGRTIALDPRTGAKLWEFTPRDIGSYQGSPQITTATPVADPDRRYVYAASPDGLIRKLALDSGSQVWAARMTFDASREKLASALNIDGPDVVVTTGGYDGDAPTYEGHVVLVDRASGRIAAVWNAECSDRHHLLDPPDSCRADTSFGGSAIWARAGAVVEPGGGRILVATGNGPFNGATDWGDSVLELSAGSLRLLHNWTPRDQASLNSNDTDLGSTAPALLPPQDGYRLAVQGGKDGMLHLLNLNRLDGGSGPAGGRLGGELQDTRSPGGDLVFTAPAVWRHGGRSYVFVGDNSGTAAYLLAPGRPPQLRQVWSNGNGGTSPVLAGGLLYVYDPGTGAVHVYLPARGREVASLQAAPGHWNSPIVIGGRVIVPTGDYHDHANSGQLFIFHLPGR